MMTLSVTGCWPLPAVTRLLPPAPVCAVAPGAANVLIDAATMTMPRCAATLLGSLAAVWSIRAPSIGSPAAATPVPAYYGEGQASRKLQPTSGRCRDELADEYDRAAWHFRRGAALGLQTDRKRCVHEVGGGCQGAPGPSRRLRLGDDPQ